MPDKYVDQLSCGWSKQGGSENDIVISTRIRLARNLIGLPFPHLLDSAKAQTVLNQVAQICSATQNFGLEFFRLTDFSENERQILVEKHLISPNLVENPENKAVVLNPEQSICIMVNEEDHLRLQSFLPGLQLQAAWENLDKIDDFLEVYLDYAFEGKWGYLTACPTNIGTGMRASLMLHLPGLVMLKQMGGAVANVNKLGFAVRGLYGEGTEALGNLYQISNQVTLGQSEEDILTSLTSLVGQIIKSERAAREILLEKRRPQIQDQVGRAYGILKHAHLISSQEALKLLSDLRLGADLDLGVQIPAELLTELMIMSRPAWLTKVAGEELNSLERDQKRAELFQATLA